MPLFIVTVKLPRNPAHNPKNKIAGICPLNENVGCTDVTGEHHSEVVTALSIAEIPSLYEEGTHITRIESVPDIIKLTF